MLADLLFKIAEMENAERGARNGSGRRPSRAGPERCIRQMVYDAAGQEPDSTIGGRALTVFDDGHWHEELVADWIRKTAYQLHSEQMRVMTKVGPGHIDGIITDITGKDRLLEIKSINHFGYERLLKGDLPLDYFTQTALYLDSKELASMDINECLMLFKNKNQGAYTEILSAYDIASDTLTLDKLIRSSGEEVDLAVTFPAVTGSALMKFNEVDQHVENGTLPDRQYDFDHWRCQYCQYQKTCWASWLDEHESLATNGELDNEVADLIRYRQETGAQKREITKEYDDLTDRIKAHLKDKGVRAGTAGEYAVELKGYLSNRIDKDKIPASVLKDATVQTPSERLNVRKIDVQKT